MKANDNTTENIKEIPSVVQMRNICRRRPAIEILMRPYRLYHGNMKHKDVRFVL